jgi:hypothetical protein
MHAVVVNVTINDREASRAQLRDEIVPMVSSAPGFVAGYWVGLPGEKGGSIVVFESEEQAQAAAARVEGSGQHVTFDSVQVGEVVASA